MQVAGEEHHPRHAPGGAAGYSPQKQQGTRVTMQASGLLLLVCEDFPFVVHKTLLLLCALFVGNFLKCCRFQSQLKKSLFHDVTREVTRGQMNNSVTGSAVGTATTVTLAST